MEFQNPSNSGPNPGRGEPLLDSPRFSPDDIDSACSTPYVSAPSSPGRGGVSGAYAGGGGACYFFSAPTSPMHYVLSSAAASAAASPSFDSPDNSVAGSFEFEFSARFPSSAASAAGSMTSADELFLNGQIRPMKLSSHLQRPQVLAPLLDLNEEEDDDEKSDRHPPEIAARGRDLKLRSRSIHRRARSHSPLRNAPLHWQMEVEEREERAKDPNPDPDLKQIEAEVATPSVSASSSRSSSTSSSSGRTSKKWVFLKDLLYRSKSEGRERGSTKEKFWHSISFSPSKEKSKPPSAAVSSSTNPPPAAAVSEPEKTKSKNPPPTTGGASKRTAAKPVNGLGRRRGPAPSPHERHYTTNRAQAEEMRRKTFLPYRQGLLGCLGFSSRSYGAINGFARTLHPVSSR